MRCGTPPPPNQKRQKNWLKCLLDEVNERDMVSYNCTIFNTWHLGTWTKRMHFLYFDRLQYVGIFARKMEHFIGSFRLFKLDFQFTYIFLIKSAFCDSYSISWWFKLKKVPINRWFYCDSHYYILFVLLRIKLLTFLFAFDFNNFQCH